MKGQKHHYGHVMHHEHPRAEHKKGGSVKAHSVDEGSVKEGDFYADEAVNDVYAGANSPTVKEAKEKKRGGRMKRKHGGMIHMGKVQGESAKMRADRPKRKSGGKVGSNMNPLSSAAHGMEPSAHKSYEPEEHGK